MIKNGLLFLFIIWASTGLSQSFEAGLYTLAGTNDQLPTWLWTNQLGKYDKHNSTIQNLELLAAYKTPSKHSDFSFDGQVQLNFLLSNNNTIRFTELYGGVKWKFLQIKVGAFSEPEAFSGLSASNGNLAYSRNARPHTRLRIGFNRFVPLLKDWLSIYGFYEEGILNDDRYVEDTHLHHKAFYIRLGNINSVQLTGGLAHYVMWWGTHPEYGELPGWESYFKYVTGSGGGANDLPTDQANVMGNGFGTYQIKLEKKWKDISACFYLSHPFDDRSGMEWQNWRDNLYGFFFTFEKDKPIVESMVLEYYYTKHQSGDYHLQPQPDGTHSGRGLDNYFNHSIYRSGVTYQQTGMVSPLFTPIAVEDGINMGFENTSFKGLHLGINGYINSQLNWKAMFTHTTNFGQKKSGGSTTYDPERKQLATLLQLNWQLKNNPLLLGVSVAADHGSLYDEGQTTSRLGAMFSVKWQIME